MKIMLVSRVIDSHRSGGMPHVASDRARALCDAGHDVHLVTTSAGGKVGVKHRPTTNLLVQPTPERPGSLTIHFTESPAHEWSGDFAKCCRAKAKELRPDIVHLDSFDRSNPWYLSLPDSVSHLAVTMHGFGWGAFQTQWNLFRARGTVGVPKFDGAALADEARSLEKFPVVIGVSKHEHRMLRDEYGLAQSTLVYNPIPQYFFDAPRPPNDKPREGFLCVAVSQGATRGFEVAKRAASVARVNLTVLNNVSRVLMPNEYDKVSAIVLPTAFGQGFDLAVCEARARGVPAIMSGTGSYLTEACGWDTLVRVHDPSSLTTALIKFAAEPTMVPLHYEEVIRHQPAVHAGRWLAALGTI